MKISGRNNQLQKYKSKIEMVVNVSFLISVLLFSVAVYGLFLLCEWMFKLLLISELGITLSLDGLPPETAKIISVVVVMIGLAWNYPVLKSQLSSHHDLVRRIGNNFERNRNG